VTGVVEHSYYLVGHVLADIRQSIDGLAHEDPRRRREPVGLLGHQWRMRSTPRSA
jgi:hypothetical protein